MTYTTKTTTIKRDLYSEVTNKIIALLEKGVAPWRQTWSAYGQARNFITNHEYQGINRLLLNNTPYPIPYFLTYNQVKQLNGSIKKGAKADQAYFFTIYYKDATGKVISFEEAQVLKSQGEAFTTFRLLKYFNLFNIANVEGVEFHIPKVELKAHEQIAKCETIMQHMPNAPQVKCINANEAYYNPKLDFINMPAIAQFTSAAEYYVTLFHEAVHATGHQSRLSRKGIVQANKFGSVPYSEEEIIAEMGAAFLSAEAGINYEEIVENNVAYLQGWLDKLRTDNKFILKVAAQAQQATRYILNTY